MPTVEEIITGVRERLGNPSHDNLNNATVYEHLKDEIDYYLVQLNLTDENWLVDSFDVSTTGNESTYTVSRPDFGRAIMVESVNTGADQNFRRKELLIVGLNEIDKFWGGYAAIGGGPYIHNSDVVAFYRETQTAAWKMRFAPPPYSSAPYRIWYEPDRPQPPKIKERPRLMEQFHALLKVDTALSCLPHCKYPDKEAQMRLDSLMQAHTRYFEAFSRFIHQNHQEDAGPRRAFNSSRMQGENFW